MTGIVLQNACIWGFVASHWRGLWLRAMRLMFLIMFWEGVAGRGDSQVAAPPYEVIAERYSTAPSVLDFAPVGYVATESNMALPYPAGEEFTSKSNDETEDALANRIKQVEQDLAKHLESEKKKKEEDKKKPLIKPRGRLHSDANWFHQSGNNRLQINDIDDGVYARRARLGFDGSFMESTEVRLDYEMGAPGHPSLFDAYGNLLHVPFFGTMRMGQFREPFSLEAQTSSNFYTFMERAYNTSFDPSRNWGVMFYNHNSAETLTWAVGAFRDQTNFFGADVTDSGGRAFTGRMTWLAHYSEENDGDDFWEIGSSYSYRDPKNDRVNYPVKPLNFLLETGRNSNDTFNVPNILQLENRNAESVQLYGLETTRTLGALNLQAEYIALVMDLPGASYYSHGSYAQASYFLTGEHRRWNRSLGTFAPTKVSNPFLTRQGKGFQGTGAWEIALRWCDINIQGTPGGNAILGYSSATTAGLNWYLNENVRMMFNASPIQLHSQSLVGAINVFNMRLDMHF